MFQPTHTQTQTHTHTLWLFVSTDWNNYRISWHTSTNTPSQPILKKLIINTCVITCYYIHWYPSPHCDGGVRMSWLIYKLWLCFSLQITSIALCSCDTPAYTVIANNVCFFFVVVVNVKLYLCCYAFVMKVYSYSITSVAMIDGYITFIYSESKIWATDYDKA